MSIRNNSTPANLYQSESAADAFAEYCGSERERRRNSGEEFDPQLFDDAVEMVLRRLRGPAGEASE